MYVRRYKMCTQHITITDCCLLIIKPHFMYTLLCHTFYVSTVTYLSYSVYVLSKRTQQTMRDTLCIHTCKCMSYTNRKQHPMTQIRIRNVPV